jgi:hypothetical protein
VNRDDIINGKAVTTLTPEELLKYVLLDLNENSVLVSNVSFKGCAWDQSTQAWTHPFDRGLSFFSHGEPDCDTVINGYTITWSLGMERGLLLTTAGGRDVEGPNSYANALPPSPPVPPPPNLDDPDMNSLTNYPVTDGALLEFDFIPQQDTISFDYIFASEEYPEYVHSEYNDIFGFFISELDADGNIIPGTTQNIALLPTTETDTKVVSINNVNNGYVDGPSNSHLTNAPQFFPGDNPKNAEYYVANYQPTPYQGEYMEYDGRTVVLTAKAVVTPGNTYHLKLGVANVSDNVLGSGVFLRAGSLNLGNLNAAFYANDIYYTNLDNHPFCENDIKFRAEINAIGIEVDSMKWYIDGIEHLSAQNLNVWSNTFAVGNFLIKLEVFPDEGDIINLEGMLHIGAHVTTTPLPIIWGTTTPSDTCIITGKSVTIEAIPKEGCYFENWTTEDGTILSSNNPYSFTVTNDSTLFAHFMHIPEGTYDITVFANPQACGTATGGGTYNGGDNVTIVATTTDTCCVFLYWTENGNEVSTDTVYSFIAKEDRTLVANFDKLNCDPPDLDSLDFDTYAVILCDRIILLDLKQLAKAGYEVTDCKWFKNEIEQTDTHTDNACSYAEESGNLLEKYPTFYTFCVTTKNYGELCSSQKIIITSDRAPDCPEVENSKNLLAYPNPVLSGSFLTLDNLVKGTLIYVYNHFGACALSFIATDSIMEFSIDLLQGIYLIRNDDKIVKVLVIK